MKSVFCVLLVSVLSLLSCTAPDTVQLSGYQGTPEQGLFASIPICYSTLPIALGDTLSEVREKTQVYEELNPTNLEEYSTLEWTEHHSENGTDSVIRCTFKNQRLVHFSSDTYLDELSPTKTELISRVDPMFTCMSEVRPILYFGKNLSYIQVDDALAQHYQILKQDSGYKGLKYEIGYTEDSMKVTIAAHS